jgi:hypothetical protein
MSVAHRGLTYSQREIAAEATSESLRPQSYEEMWERPSQRGLLREQPIAGPGRAPVFTTILAIMIGASGLIALRERIVRVAPASAAAYRALGMPVNLLGLELRDVHSRVVMDGNRRVLVTEGEIVNIRRDQNRVPPIALAVRGGNGLDRYAWTAPTPKSRLEAGEKIAFRARLASPPEDGAEVLVRFAKLDAAALEAKSPSAPVKRGLGR